MGKVYKKRRCGRGVKKKVDSLAVLFAEKVHFFTIIISSLKKARRVLKYGIRSRTSNQEGAGQGAAAL